MGNHRAGPRGSGNISDINAALAGMGGGIPMGVPMSGSGGPSQDEQRRVASIQFAMSLSLTRHQDLLEAATAIDAWIKTGALQATLLEDNQVSLDI